MKKLWIIALFALVAAVGCKKGDLNFNNSSGAVPAVPVTVANAAYFTNGLPTVTTSVSGGGAIEIKLSIPSSSGRTIKEISRVALGTTTSNYKVVESSTGLYNTAPVSASGTTVSFTTSLTEYTAKTGLSVTTSGTATSFLARYFYFMITLDDGSQIIPVPVRVYVNS